MGACLQANYLLDCKSFEGKFPCVKPHGIQHNPAHAVLLGCVSAERIKEETHTGRDCESCVAFTAPVPQKSPMCPLKAGPGWSRARAQTPRECHHPAWVGPL